jgi:predicted RNA binding protein YcfA (HicA-like mRNA interferase family)
VSDGLPVVSGQRLVKALERAGWEVARQRGSHVRMKHRDRRIFLTVPLHRELKRGTLSGTSMTPEWTSISYVDCFEELGYPTLASSPGLRQ